MCGLERKRKTENYETEGNDVGEGKEKINLGMEEM